MEVTEKGDLRCSGSLLGNFTCFWTLKNFSKLDATSGFEYKSKNFPRKGSVIWHVSIYPGGEHLWEKGEVHCYLKCVSAPENGVGAKYEFSFRDIRGETIRSHSSPYSGYMSVLQGCRSFPLFLPRDSLLSQLTNDTLIVAVEGRYSFSVLMSNEEVTFSRKVSSFAKLADDMLTLSKNSFSSDVVISVGGYNIPAHSVILAARSSVFASMFKHDTEEKNSGHIVVTDFDLDTLKLLLQFVYCGKLDSLDVSQAVELLRAADKYEIGGLKICCSQFLTSHLDETNVVQMLVFADMFSSSQLKHEAIEFFCKHKSLVDFEKDQSLLMQLPDVLCDLVQAMQKI